MISSSTSRSQTSGACSELRWIVWRRLNAWALKLRDVPRAIFEISPSGSQTSTLIIAVFRRFLPPQADLRPTMSIDGRSGLFPITWCAYELREWPVARVIFRKPPLAPKLSEIWKSRQPANPYEYLPDWAEIKMASANKILVYWKNY